MVTRPGCAFCGEVQGEKMFFTCNYCGLQFCPDHRIPESHNCDFSRGSMNVPTKATTPAPQSQGESTRTFLTAGSYGPSRSKRKSKTAPIAVAVVVLLAVSYFGLASYNSWLQVGGSSTVGSSSVAMSSSTMATSSQVSASSSTLSTPSSFSQSWLSSPSFQDSRSDVTYPPNYSELQSFALDLINKDRTGNGVQAVAVSSVQSGQQHADSLAYFGTSGHWDVQGYKPYMRYSLLNGTGYVAENVAPYYCTDSPPPAANETYVATCNIQTIENAIANGEYEMMYQDATCCNNGHRSNILDPLHNAVSIGIAYNQTTNLVYFVEDFENSYISSESLSLSAGAVTLQGSTGQSLQGWTSSSSGAAIEVYYDPPPSSIAANLLMSNPSCNQYNEYNEPTSCQYQGAYTLGTEVTSVFAPCPAGYTCQSGYTYAQTWEQDSAGNFEITFSISSMESTYGKGVYTLYLFPVVSNQPITSLSLFVS